MNRMSPTTQSSPGWWQRHWKWAVPVLVALLMCLFAGVLVLFFAGVMGLLKSSDAYVQALERTRSSPAAQAALGAPVEEGWWMSGSIESNEVSGEAALAIPVSGPKGGGKVFVEATKSAGQWTFHTLVLQVDQGGLRIDLRTAEEQRTEQQAAEASSSGP